MTHSMSIQKYKHVVALLGLLLLATALRFYKLDAQSLWYDEGNSARIAERSVQLIIAGAAGDIHPPLYYLILKFWRSVFGSSEFGLRSLSAMCGVLLVLFTFLMGRTWCNVRVGFIAAFLVCISPFSIYYSQETRMYALLAVWAAVSTWALMRLGIGGWGLGVGACYVLATTAGLYTQYAYPFVMLAQGVCVLLWLANVRRKLQHLVLYGLLNIIPILLYAPWLPIALRQIRGWVVAPQEYQLGPAVLDALRWLTVGRMLPLSDATLPMLAFVVCAMLGLLLTRRNEETKKEASSFLSSFLRFFVLFILALLPLALLFAFKLYRDAYLKFLLVCLAPLCLWVANGIDASVDVLIERLKGRKQMQGIFVGLCLVVFAGLLWPSLNNLYNNPAYARDDYRAIAKLLREGERADDAVLFIAPNQWEVFTYYYPDTQKTFPLKYKPVSEADANAEMMKITVLRKRLFVLYYAEKEADPNGWYERWLATHAFKAEEQWIGNIRLAVYASPNFMAGIAPRNVVFGEADEAIELVRNQLFDFKVRVGDVVPLGLIWQANTKVNTNYKIFVHIGKPDAPPIAQNDGEPAAGFRPTSGWAVGKRVSDGRAVWIHPGTPPGQYAIFVGLYDANTGARLKLQDGSDRLKIGEIAVVGE